ncbi:arsenate reductase (glutaredoxin) [Flavobacterium frigoris]|uniref:Arsenate reductase n=1 Tax=Flavobacterium frigoris TaxID=229204 RepID=A0A1H9NZW5_FLAFI|nr:arsenate reductase (glutaredoxin) [Flavobacterium frigoris]SER41574.1 arsenate reductase [Flavobacterium frigoris]
MIQIYHNPRCGKSRNCVAFIEEAGKEYEIIEYLKNPPTKDELLALLKKLNIKPLELIRQKEKIWADNFKNLKMTDEEIIKAMVENPILIERPIVIKRDKAIIGRELDKITDFL